MSRDNVDSSFIVLTRVLTGLHIRKKLLRNVYFPLLNIKLTIIPRITEFSENLIAFWYGKLFYHELGSQVSSRKQCTRIRRNWNEFLVVHNCVFLSTHTHIPHGRALSPSRDARAKNKWKRKKFAVTFGSGKLHGLSDRLSWWQYDGVGVAEWRRNINV